jgi:putative tricarboxylic transport membrane protein
VNYIAFAGGGAALAAVLGGQLSAAVSGYAEFAGQIAAGQLRVLAISSASRVSGIDAPTLRESGIALDLSNWRATVAPPGLSDAEEEALTARITKLATSPKWRSTLAQNGWADEFLTGPPLRQFLLAEQARIEDVLRRLSATNSRAPTTLSVTLTPSSLPNAVAMIFLGALALTAFTTTRQSVAFDRQGRRMTVALVTALLALPIAFVTAGFVASSTLLFATGQTADNRNNLFAIDKKTVCAIVDRLLSSTNASRDTRKAHIYGFQQGERACFRS